jgi:ubiquinone/menaquinone biosynthesis C-methylase UbiE
LENFVYEVEAQVEQHHWWFTGRRKLFARIIQQLGIPTAAPTLDVGTSVGTNLRMLRDSGFSDVVGLDFSDEAARWCAEKGLGTVRKGDITAMPFEDESFSLVLATDIIEHVDDDRRALSEIRRVLKPGGHVLITVPAFPSLWGLHDEVSQHKRRYRAPTLLDLIRDAGLELERHYHFNYLLFAPIWATRQLMKRWKPATFKSENEVNTPTINRILSVVFDLDIATAPGLRPPFGVSILAVARRPAAH